MMEGFVSEAINSTLQGGMTYCKFLSANDSGETGGHQSGILISKSARAIMFTAEEIKQNHIFKRNIRINLYIATGDLFCSDGRNAEREGDIGCTSKIYFNISKRPTEQNLDSETFFTVCSRNGKGLITNYKTESKVLHSHRTGESK